MRRVVVLAAGFAAAAAGCVPTLPQDPIPELMEFDPESFPPRVPQPTSLLINPATGHIDFSLAGLKLPDDCTKTMPPISQAECEFDQYLQSLDGFPTVTPGSTPASVELDPETITPSSGNVVVVAAKAGQPVTDLQIGFNAGSRSLTMRSKHWNVGEFYWAAVRGYENGVRAVGGAKVVGAVPQFLIKQETSLTCDAATPDDLDPKCPAYALLLQKRAPAAAAATLFRLEQIRNAYRRLHAYEAIAAAGIPKEEVAVIWGFPVHSSSVAELDPSPAAMIVPQLSESNKVIKVAVQGPVDPATVKSYILQERPGSVLVMDLTAAVTNLVQGLPRVDAKYEDGHIVITAVTAPFVTGHQIGLFFTKDIKDPMGRSLVPSPVSKLLTLRGSLLNSAGKSAILAIGDADATMLEDGRKQLATLFDMDIFRVLTGVSREVLVYCFAFPVVAP